MPSMSEPSPTPVNRVAAFLLGLGGFLLFAVLAIMAVKYYANRGTGYEDARAKARQEWRAAAADAQAALYTSTWKDKNAGLAQIAAADYLPIAAKALLAPENAPRVMKGDKFIVPGTPTFDAFAARQASEAAFPAPTTGAAPAAPAPNAPAPAPEAAPAAPAPAPAPAPEAAPAAPAPAPAPEAAPAQAPAPAAPAAPAPQL